MGVSCLHQLFLNHSSSHLHTATLFGIAVAVVTLALILLYLNGFDAVAALRDGWSNDKPEAGLISNIGVFLMGIASISAMFWGYRHKRLPLLALGVFCGLFALDDALLLHERLGRREIIVFVMYGIFLIYILIAFTRQNGGRVVWPLIYTFAAFGASVVIDVAWGPLLDTTGMRFSQWPLERIGYCLEDIPKFGGIVLLSSLAIGEVGSLKPSVSR